MLHPSGVVQPQPNAHWDEDFYRREATGWRFVSRLVLVKPGGHPLTNRQRGRKGRLQSNLDGHLQTAISVQVLQFAFASQNLIYTEMP